MPVLNLTLYGNTLGTWLTAAVVVFGTLLALGLVRRMLLGRLSAIMDRTQTDLDNLAVQLLHRTHFLFLLVLAVYAGTLVLKLDARVLQVMRGALVIALSLQAAVWGNTLISYWLQRYRQRAADQDASVATTVSALGFISRLVLWTAILLVALQNLNIKVDALIAGLGIGGIAVALAVQNILGDLFASLSIVLDKPFLIGDFIIVGEYMGTVEHIGLKTTRIRSLSGEQVVFANADLLNSRIRNYKRMQERRILFGFGVTYQTPADTLESIPAMVREIIEAQPHTRFDRAHFKAYGASSLDFEVVYYMLLPDYTLYMDTQQTINLALLRRFAAEGIEFAYPTQTIFLAGGGGGAVESRDVGRG